MSYTLLNNNDAKTLLFFIFKLYNNTPMKQKSSTHSSIIRYAQAPFLEIRVKEQSDRVYKSHAHPPLSIGAIREGKTSFYTPHRQDGTLRE